MPDIRARLLGRIHRTYQTVTERIVLPCVELEFTRVADPDVVLDMVAEEDERREKAAGRRLGVDELHLPYWAELWDSALAVAQVLCSGGEALRGQNVLDLGCGQGLTGTVAAAVGARVLFADIETPPLLFAALNSLPWRARVRTRRMNWRSDALSERFDLIVGADILYERAQWPYLEPFFRRHLKDGGRVLLGEPGRPAGDDFPEWIEAHGWAITQTTQAARGRGKTVRIFELKEAPAKKPAGLWGPRA